MIIGTAGHIDHGKTALVKALTGIDADRLPQEKQRGITIELGFAYQTLKNGERIGFVDVPGHEKLIHTMLTGAGSMDYVMLVVAADDGIMPQTREHVEILKLLGVKHGLVAITRIDLVNKERLDVLEAELRKFLKGSFLENAPIFRVSAKTGEGISAVRSEIEKAASRLGKRVSHGRFRHAVDRCFLLSGAGTVVTGTVMSGKAGINETMVIAPDHLKARLRSIHVQDEVADKAETGDRAALNIVGESINKDTVKRGMMVIDPFLDKPTQRFDVRLSVLASEPKPLKQWFPVHLHHGSLETNARMVFLTQDSMNAGDTAYAQIISDKPIIAVTGDHFIIRDTSASRTIGGGIILDPQAPERHRRSQKRFQFLAAMEKENHREALAALLALPPFGVDWASFCRARNLSSNEAKHLLSSGNFVILEDGQDCFIMEQAKERGLQAFIVDYLQKFHQSDPDLFGVGLEKLRRDIAPDIRAPYFRHLLQNEIDAGSLKIRGAWVSLAGHEAKLTPKDDAIWQQVYKRLTGTERFRPPRTRDFAYEFSVDEDHMREILKTCARMGKVYEVAQDYFFPREVLAEIVAVMCNIASQKQSHEFVAADLRDHLNNGRKVAILMLEFFDRHGVTIRRGDVRRLNPHRLDLFRDN